MKVVVYVRVSTDEQARDGVSLDSQADKVRAYARRHPAWRHARVYARRTGRPAYQP